jgi:hypothetical protein
MNRKLMSLLSALVLSNFAVFAIGRPLETSLQQPNIEQIIAKFAAAETRNMVARNGYTFTQEIDLTTLGEGGSITGKFRRNSDIVFDDLGKRFEKISFFPPHTLAVSITQEDMQDIAGVQPFALTTEDLPKYQVTYVGKEKIDELNTYIFEVRPRQFKKGERYLEGRVWVEDEDFQIVKVAGKAVPEVGEQRFPRFETYRENIDGRYWFPTYTYGDDVLEFKHNSVRLRMLIRYKNYKKFSTDIRLTDEGGVATEDDLKNNETDKKAGEAGKEKPETAPPPPTEKPKKKPGA